MTALVLAIASWVLCGCLTSIPAILVARSELGAIERGEAPLAGKSMAQAAFWLGVVNTGIYALVLAYLLIVGVAIGAVVWQGIP